MLRFLILLIAITSTNHTALSQEKYSLRLATFLVGTTAPKSVTDKLTLIDVEFYDNNNVLQRGTLVAHKALANDLTSIFEYIKQERIPIEMVEPIKFDLPGGNTSMAKLNNTYSFHYRQKAAAKSLSLHSYGTAIDINPYNNPYISPTGDTIPKGATYHPTTDPRSLHKNHPLVLKFKQMGWTWGGDWTSIKDYMHFQKRLQ